MNEWIRVSVLGVVQGITEFLPVSSDGHLALFQGIVQADPDTALALDVVLHIGTLLAMLLFFRKDVWGVICHPRRWPPVIVACAATAPVGFALKHTVEKLSTSFVAAGCGFLMTAGVLAWGEVRSRRQQGLSFSVRTAPLFHALCIGLVQGAAVWPGLSRSASTIAVALALGWSWEEAGRFSFLAAMPAIMGATLLTAKDISLLPVGSSVLGLVVSFGVGIFSLGLLMKFIRARRLWPFSLYTFALGLLALWKGLA